MQVIDPIRLEVIRAGLVAAAEEMSIAIWRTSRSPSVRDILDYSTSVFDMDGNNVAQASRIPVHLNSMATCLDSMMKTDFPVDQWSEGDVVLTNDPYRGGAQHLPDILTFRPVFISGEFVGIVGTLCHHIDVGGGAPSSYDPGATEIFQEGLRLPPMKIVKAGQINRDVMEIIRLNVREPEMVIADIEAQIAALEIGARTVQRVGKKDGPSRLKAAMRQVQDQSDRAMRQAIGDMPDGTYAFEDFVDDDGQSENPILVRAAITIAGDQVTVDFEGSAGQASGPINCTLNMTKSAVYYAVMAVAGDDIPANSGCYRSINVTAPPGSVVNAQSPAPVANRMILGHRIVNTVMGAMAQALPDRVPAAYYGVSYVYSLQPEHADGRRQVYFEIEVGGWGGSSQGDGPSAFSAGFHNLANAPVEMIESMYPITFTGYGLLPDSGGAGRHRGGLGLFREYRLDAPKGRLNASCDRFTRAPYGLAGGAEGSKGKLILKRNGTSKPLHSKAQSINLVAGDIVRLETSGGGGHGDPKTRDADAIARDLSAGYVSPAKAQQLYGKPKEG